MPLLIRFLFIIAAFAGTFAVNAAAEVKDYIGNQSFELGELGDEQDLSILLSSIKKINTEGAQSGQRDGVMDGADLSLKFALEFGRSDGIFDGNLQSLQDAQKLLIAESFKRKIPNYPEDYHGPNFKPKIYHSKIIMMKAFEDGYVFKYKQYSRLEFKRKIDTDYSQVYDAHYKAAYEMAIGHELFE